MQHTDPSSGKNVYLHVLVDEGIRTIEFLVMAQGKSTRVDVRSETINMCFGVHECPHGLLMAYEAHRAEIDAAVIRRAVDGGAGIVMVRPSDLKQAENDLVPLCSAQHRIRQRFASIKVACPGVPACSSE